MSHSVKQKARNDGARKHGVMKMHTPTRRGSEIKRREKSKAKFSNSRRKRYVCNRVSFGGVIQ